MWEIIAPRGGRWTFDDEGQAKRWLDNVKENTTGWLLRECTYSGYRNEATYEFIATTENDRETYELLLAYSAQMLRRVPSMTEQTLGHNIKLTCRSIVHQVRNGEHPSIYGWADFLRVPRAVARLLTELDDRIGLEHVSEDDLGASWRETLADTEEHVCAVCSERIIRAPRGWVHIHSGDTYCHTGDGATAYPKENRS